MEMEYILYTHLIWIQNFHIQHDTLPLSSSDVPCMVWFGDFQIY